MTTELKPNVLYEFLHLSPQVLILIYLLLIIACVSTAGWVYVLKKKKTAAYRIIMGSDIGKFSTLLLEDLKAMEIVIRSTKNNEIASTNGAIQHIESMKETVGKMNHYLNKELQKIAKVE